MVRSLLLFTLLGVRSRHLSQSSASHSFPSGKCHFFLLQRLFCDNDPCLWTQWGSTRHTQTMSIFFFFFTNSTCGWTLLWYCVSGNQNLLCHFTLVKLSPYLTFTENRVFYFKHPNQQDHLSCKTGGWRLWRESRKTSCLRGHCSCGRYQVSALGETEGVKGRRWGPVSGLRVTGAAVMTTCPWAAQPPVSFFLIVDIIPFQSY